MVNIKPINGPVKWTRNPKCKYKISKTVKDTLDKHGVEEAKEGDWAIHLPCTYNNIKKEVEEVTPDNDDQRVFVVNNADELTSKNHIWKNLVKAYGRDYARTLMPLTYILSVPHDLATLEAEHDPNKIYILKKNVQRQEGLRITRDLDRIKKSVSEGFVIAQELLQTPYTIDGRKINMRFYLLLVCQNNEISAYVHREGFMYYTKLPFIKNSTQKDPNITTGYIDREVYQVNPLTHDDFRKYLDDYKGHPLTQSEVNLVRSQQRISRTVFDRIYQLLSEIVYSVKHTVCVDSHLKSYLTFQLFGADIAIDDELKPQLIEVNKGPDMGFKDKRDGDVKSTVMADVFKVLKVLPEDQHGFVKIYDEDKPNS